MYILFHPDVQGMKLYYRKLQCLPLVAMGVNIYLAQFIFLLFEERQICLSKFKSKLDQMLKYYNSFFKLNTVLYFLCNYSLLHDLPLFKTQNYI